MNSFSVFVIPFCAGVLVLLGISIWKYWRWIKALDKLQRATIRKNIWSWRFLPAIWEAIRESLLHFRISKKNLILGYMHRSLAFGWFLLIVVGAVQAHLAYPGGKPFWMAIFYNYFEPDCNPVAFPKRTIMKGLQQVGFAGAICAEEQIDPFMRGQYCFFIISEITECQFFNDHFLLEYSDRQNQIDKIISVFRHYNTRADIGIKLHAQIII